MSKKDLYLFAPNISHGGGFLLLKQLLLSASKQKKIIFGSINEKLDHENEIELEPKRTQYFKGSITDYFSSNYHLARNNKESTTYLFFGNVPPLIKPKGKSFLYIHGKLLLEPVNKYKLPFSTKFKVILNKTLIRLFHQNIDVILVQTPSMIKLLNKMLPAVQVECLPFYEYHAEITQKKKKYDFIYPSYAYTYKNHNNLMKAFKSLSEEGIYPSLLLALDTKIDTNLVRQITSVTQKYKLEIFQVLDKDTKEISEIYQDAACLIWPSLTESFGLPIIEASRNGLDIIASDLEYIRDFIEIDDPYLFDPNDHYSIAKTIKNYINKGHNYNEKNHKASIEILSPMQVINFIFSK